MRWIAKKGKKKKIAFIIVISMLAAMFSNVSISNNVKAEEQTITMSQLYEAKDSQEEVSDSGITISSAEELRYLAEYVNSGKETEGKTFVLQEDISLSDYQFQYLETENKTGIYTNDILCAAVGQDGTLEVYYSVEDETEAFIDTNLFWESIGTTEYPFSGTFDGQGHSIQGMVSVKETEMSGLFSVIGSEGTIKNITVKDSLAVGSAEVGILVGQNNGLVTNCTVSAITMSQGCVGGMVGSNYGTLQYCTSEDVIVAGPEIDAEENLINDNREKGVGGVVGISNGYCGYCTMKGSKSQIVFGGGGVIGYILGGIVTNCSNYSDLWSEAGSEKGGIACILYQGIIANCINYGKVEFEYEFSFSSLGGIVARVEALELNVEIRECGIYNCINYGDLCQRTSDMNHTATEAKYGGIVGKADIATISNCANYGNISVGNQESSEWEQVGGKYGVLRAGGIIGDAASLVYVANCYNIGNLDGGPLLTGGIVGAGNEINAYNCYSIGEVKNIAKAGEICGFMGDGTLEKCYYLQEEGHSLAAYQWETGCGWAGLGDISYEDCREITKEEVEKELYQWLNAGAALWNKDLKNRKVSGWYVGEEGYPVIDWGSNIISGESVLPTATPTIIVTETPTLVPNTETPAVTPTEMPTITPDTEMPVTAPTTETPVVTATVAPQNPSEGDLSPSETLSKDEFSLEKISKVKLSVTKKKVKISWKKLPSASYYEIYRKQGGKKGYKKIATITNKTVFHDKKVKKGKTYCYKICGCYVQDEQVQRSGFVVRKTGKIPWYNAPVVKIKKETLSEKERYLKFSFKRYTGEHLEILLGRKKNKYQKLTIHSLKKYKGTIRLSYSRKGKVLYCKLRTYRIAKGKKRYSAYSSVKKIRL